jgi:hypothetical protein
MTEKHSRDALIVEMHVSYGLNLAQIGREFGLTRERVRQIIAKQGAPSLTRERLANRKTASRQARAARKAARRAYRDSLEWIADRSDVDENGCWIWNRATYPYGYGHTARNRGNGYAHRVAWEIANGATIPDGMCICHSCDVPSCVNPDHLFLGTHLDNVYDSIRKGRRRVSRSHPLACEMGA